MARYKPQDFNSLLLPVVLSEQITPGTFAFALNYLVDHELDLSVSAQQTHLDGAQRLWLPVRRMRLVAASDAATTRRSCWHAALAGESEHL
jgi:hypothetical protein